MPPSNPILSFPLLKIFLLLHPPLPPPLPHCIPENLSLENCGPRGPVISWGPAWPSGKASTQSSRDYFSQTLNISNYITPLFFPFPDVFNKDHFHPLKSESKHRNVLLKMLASVWMTGYIKMYKMLDFLINTARKRYL